MSVRSPAQIKIPPGTPEWITVELIEQTLRVWQPRSLEPLTIADAIQMIRSMASLVQVLSGGETDATVRSTRSRQQS